MAQDYDSVLVRHPIHSGDTVYVPGGIIHSFGPDALLVFEVQQTSDLGSMVMPVDLYGRPHSEEQWHANIQQTLDELKNDYHPRPNPGLILCSGRNHRSFGCAGPYFALECWSLVEPYTEPAHPCRCTTLTNVGDRVHIEYAGGTELLERGESCILPAAIGEVNLIPTREANLVVCYVPDLQQDVVEPLRSAGYTDEQIRTLGEVT